VSAAAALWIAGALGTVRPEILAGLLLVSLAGGTGVLLATIFTTRRSRHRAGAESACVLGVLSLAAGGGFLHRLFAVEEGAVPVETRVVAPAEAPDRLRVVDLNVLHGYPDFVDQEQRFRDTLAALRALAPDIVVLQEAWHTSAHGQLADRLGQALNMDHVYARANGSLRLLGFEEGSAILSRYPITRARRLVLRPRSPWWERRIALVVSVSLGGEPITVAGTHMKGAVSDRQSQSLLGRLPRDGMRLVAGDINAGSESDAARVFRDHGFIDVVPGGIDHVFVPAGGIWAVESAGWTLRAEDLAALIGKRVAISDHPGILVDLVRTARTTGASGSGGVARPSQWGRQEPEIIEVDGGRRGRGRWTRAQRSLRRCGRRRSPARRRAPG
jgi:Endonuclease/Exonuclease/phosphatase family